MLLTPGFPKRLALAFGILGVSFMGADLLITRDFFTHAAELMAADMACFIMALVLDHRVGRQQTSKKI